MFFRGREIVLKKRKVALGKDNLGTILKGRVGIFVSKKKSEHFMNTAIKELELDVRCSFFFLHCKEGCFMFHCV
jgi:hypothetical protein